MRKSMDRTGRGVVCAPASLALSAALSSAVAAPAPGESARIPFTERYHVTQHGGIARAANSSVTCKTTAGRTATPCAVAQQGGAGRNSLYRMAAIDGDSDARTANSSSATLHLPAGSRVSYARLYWGPLTGHRPHSAAEGFQASADVTRLVRSSGAGAYTVAQINMATGHSATGVWGGWTLVAAYENKRQPLRSIALWDGFQALGADRRELSLRLPGPRIPANSHGRAGLVAYDGDRGRGNDTLSVRAGRHTAQTVRDAANPATDVMNSTVTDFGRPTVRWPAYRNTLGFDSDVFDITPALRSGGDRLTFRFTARDPGNLLGALFVQTDTRR